MRPLRRLLRRKRRFLVIDGFELLRPGTEENCGPIHRCVTRQVYALPLKEPVDIFLLTPDLTHVEIREVVGGAF